MDTATDPRALSAERNVAEAAARQSLQFDMSDQDRLREAIHGTEMEVVLFSGGDSGFEHHQLTLGPAVLNTGRYGPAVLAKGGWPAGQVVIGSVLETQERTGVNGHLCRQGSIQVYAEGAEVDYRAPPGGRWLAFATSRARLEEKLDARAADRLADHLDRGMSTFQPSDDAASAFRRWVDDIHAAPDTGLLPEAVEAIFHDHLTCMLSGTAQAGTRPEPRWTIVRRAEHYLATHLTETFDLEATACFAGTTPRMLQHHVRALRGTTPSDLLRTMRLHMARRALLRYDKSQISVTQVALRVGFDHLGRFSTTYRERFGETPSRTLSRASPIR